MGAARIGVDVGGTKILAVVIGTPGGSGPAVRVLAEAEVPTPLGTDAVVDAIVGTVHRVLDEVGAATATVGVGLPGLVDRTGVLRYGPNLPGVLDADVGRMVGDRLGSALEGRVVVDNDGNCAALAEARLGAAAGARSALFVGLGTGIACGILLGGRLWRGAHGFAGEPGHMRVDPSGPRCACGARGCWETVGSGRALDRVARALGFAGAAELTDAERDRAPDVGGRRAAALDAFAAGVASGLVGLCNVMDPEVVVIGGSVMNAADVLLERIDRSRTAQRFGGARGALPPLRVAAFGRTAGAIGAALLPVDDRPGGAG